MHPIQFRAAAGPEDAVALIAVHDACRETDRVREDLCYEYLPTLEHYRKRLANTDPEDWVVVQSGAEVLGYGHLLSSWAEHNGKKVYLHLGWVVPQARGKGIGRELLSRLEARCREKRAQDGTAGEAEQTLMAGKLPRRITSIVTSMAPLPILPSGSRHGSRHVLQASCSVAYRTTSRTSTRSPSRTRTAARGWRRRS